MSEVTRARPLGPDRVDDFLALHHAEQGLGWCRCVAWWVPTWSGWGERGEAENLALRRQLFERGAYDGYLLYEGSTPVGWCQVGPRDRLTKLLDVYRLAPDPQMWAITCLALRPSHRGRGLAHRLVADLLQDLRRRGVARVQAFPRGGHELGPGEVWTGAVSIFQRAGFTIDRAHETRPIYVREL